MKHLVLSYPGDPEVLAEQECYYNLPLRFESFMPITSLRECQKSYEPLQGHWESSLIPNNVNTDYVSLALERTIHAKRDIAHVPSYFLTIEHQQEAVGYIELRVGYTEKTYYGGNISCEINGELDNFNEIISRACRLLIPLAKYHRMTCLCLSSKREEEEFMPLFESLGAEYRRTISLPGNLDIAKGDVKYRKIAFWNVP